MAYKLRTCDRRGRSGLSQWDSLCPWITTPEESINIGQKWVASKLTSRFVGQAHRLSFFLVAATTVLVALPLLPLNGKPLTSGTTSSIANTPKEGNRTTTNDMTSPSPDKSGQFNVKTYGAVGDGSTDDTAAIRSAITAFGNRWNSIFPSRCICLTQPPYLQIIKQCILSGLW